MSLVALNINVMLQVFDATLFLLPIFTCTVNVIAPVLPAVFYIFITKTILTKFFVFFCLFLSLLTVLPLINTL